MVKGGCTCGVWQRVKNPETPEEKRGHKWAIKNLTYDSDLEMWIFYNIFITHCPWCGSPLTPPEEDGNEAE